MDYQCPDAAVVADTYLLPRINDCLDSLEGAWVFIEMDAPWKYEKMPIKVDDIDETTIIFQSDTYRYNRMPFGLRNALAIFQRRLKIIQYEVWWKACLFHIGDVGILSNNNLQHVKDMARFMW